MRRPLPEELQARAAGSIRYLLPLAKRQIARASDALLANLGTAHAHLMAGPPPELSPAGGAARIAAAAVARGGGLPLWWRLEVDGKGVPRYRLAEASSSGSAGAGEDAAVGAPERDVCDQHSGGAGHQDAAAAEDAAAGAADGAEAAEAQVQAQPQMDEGLASLLPFLPDRCEGSNSQPAAPSFMPDSLARTLDAPRPSQFPDFPSAPSRLPARRRSTSPIAASSST